MGYVEELRAIVGHRVLILACAGTMVFDEQDRLLLIERTDNGLWGLVGGVIEPGETTEDAARRETFEEVGLRLGHLELLGVCSGPELFQTYPNGDQAFLVSVVYVAREPGQALRPDPAEAKQAHYFPLTELPPNLTNSTACALDAYRRRVLPDRRESA